MQADARLVGSTAEDDHTQLAPVLSNITEQTVNHGVRE